MNWKNNLILQRSLFVLIVIFSIFLLLASAVMGFALYNEYKQQYDDAKEKQEKVTELQESLISKAFLYLEKSPLGTRNVVTYQINNKPLFENHILIVVQNVNGKKEEPLFIGEERTGVPKWLDDDHIFFTSHCGTSCQGVYLINVLNKETKLATLSFTFSGTSNWETHFSDWFGNKFQFPGLLGDMDTEFSNDNFYLVFADKNESDNDPTKKRFLFTGNSLQEK